MARPAQGYIFASKPTLHTVIVADDSGTNATTLVPPGFAGLNQPQGIVVRGWDILVASMGTDSIKIYSTPPIGGGASSGEFLTAADGLDNPMQLKMGPDGLLYVACQGNDRILRFNVNTGTTGDAVPFISGGLLDGPVSFDWSPDQSILYVACRDSGYLLGFNAATGAPLPAGHIVASGLSTTTTYSVAVVPNGDIFVTTGSQLRKYSPAGSLLSTQSTTYTGLQLEAGGASLLAGLGNNLRRISVATGTASAAILSPANAGAISFFSFPVPYREPDMFTVTSGGQRYLAARFAVPKGILGGICLHVSNDLNNWQVSASYVPGSASGVSRAGGSQSVAVSLLDQGDRVIVTERDVYPIGFHSRRYFTLIPGYSCP